MHSMQLRRHRRRSLGFRTFLNTENPAPRGNRSQRPCRLAPPRELRLLTRGQNHRWSYFLQELQSGAHSPPPSDPHGPPGAWTGSPAGLSSGGGIGRPPSDNSLGDHVPPGSTPPRGPPQMGRRAWGECAGSERPAGDGGRPAPPHRAAPHLRRVPGPPGRRPEGLRALIEGANSNPHWCFFLTMASATVRFFL